LTAFFDSSALVKLYIPEVGHEQVRRVPDPIVISDLARVEVPAAFWRKTRVGELSRGQAASLTAVFETDLFGTGEIPRFDSVPVEQRTLTRAARLVAVHPLRGYDALQLASALIVRDLDATCTRFVAFDNGLRGAAAAEGFELVPHD
jgi:predicted nucleic acid-binding protein